MADPRIKLALGQTALCKRGLEHTDRLLAVVVGGLEAAERLRRYGW